MGKFNLVANSFPFTNKEFVIRKTVKSIRGVDMYAEFSTSVFLCHQVSEEIFYRILFCSYSLTNEGTCLGVGTVLSRDLAYLIDLSELCLP
jgi:hypothetical protein